MTKPAVPESLVLHRDGAVLWIRLHRPEARNGIDPATRDGLAATLGEGDRDTSVRCIVLTGTGADFCVGADLAAADSEPPHNALEYRNGIVPFQRLFQVLWELETPVVSAVNGTVAGIGWMLALLPDLVVAADGARWTHVFARRGMAPHAGDPFFLPRILPFHFLNEIALLSDTVRSEDLARVGAVNRVVPADQVENTAREMAQRLASGPTLSLGQTKRLYRRSLVSDMATSFSEELAATAMLSTTEDRGEGLAAMREGRRPDFRGR